jgi:hypothetical protein
VKNTQIDLLTSPADLSGWGLAPPQPGLRRQPGRSSWEARHMDTVCIDSNADRSRGRRATGPAAVPKRR